MGKKLSQSSVKISKNCDQKQQFNSLIKVLRPKVYITDRSSFKKLVQELTGNNNGRSMSSNTFSPPPLEQNMVENYCSLFGSDHQVHNHDLRNPETSHDVSVSSNATGNSFETCYDVPLMNNEDFNNQVFCNQICIEDTFYQDSVEANKHFDDLLAYQNNLESLLFDGVDPNPFYNCYEQIEGQEEISIYDYELCGLL